LKKFNVKQLQKQSAARSQNKLPYIVNLDPAVSHIPYTALYDIRSKIKIKDVMKDYNLGPNGGILTSLNLFSTQFDQLCDKMEAQRDLTE
jgi:GPN-loop GTPase